MTKWTYGIVPTVAIKERFAANAYENGVWVKCCVADTPEEALAHLMDWQRHFTAYSQMTVDRAYP